MAIAESHLAATYNRPGYNLVDHYVYAIVMMVTSLEGVAADVISSLISGHLH
jgi:transketolase